MAKKATSTKDRSKRERVLAIVESFEGASALPVLQHLKLMAGKKRFGWYMENHHGNGRIEIQCKGRKGRSQELATKNPGIYFIPSYNGKLGNIGIWLDVAGIDWKEVADILFEAYAICVPTKVLVRKRKSVMSRPIPNATDSHWIRTELRSDDQPLHGFPMVCIDCLKPTTSRKIVTAVRDRAGRYPLPRDFHAFDLPMCTRCRCGSGNRAGGQPHADSFVTVCRGRHRRGGVREALGAPN